MTGRGRHVDGLRVGDKGGYWASVLRPLPSGPTPAQRESTGVGQGAIPVAGDGPACGVGLGSRASPISRHGCAYGCVGDGGQLSDRFVLRVKVKTHPAIVYRKPHRFEDAFRQIVEQGGDPRTVYVSPAVPVLATASAQSSASVPTGARDQQQALSPASSTSRRSGQ